MLNIALPNKGRLSEKIYQLLNSAGLVFPAKDERSLQVITYDGRYSAVFVRTQDIPMFVENGIADIGFTGFDILTECGADAEKVMDLDFGFCEMVIAVKEEDSYKTSSDLPCNLKIASSFPNIARRYFEKLGKNPKVIEISGAVEITPRLGLADCIVDISSSGSTLKSNKLRVIDKILKSNAIVIQNKNLSSEKKEQTAAVLRALKSVIDAREKKYLMANVPKTALEEIKTFMPGLSSPTIMTLAGDDEHAAIHVVVDSDKVFDSIDRLKKLGGQGILIMTVDQMVK